MQPQAVKAAALDKGRGEYGKEGSSDHHHTGLHRVQGTELHDDEESQERSRAVGAEEVLSALSYAHSASRNEIDFGVGTAI